MAGRSRWRRGSLVEVEPLQKLSDEFEWIKVRWEVGMEGRVYIEEEEEEAKRRRML